MRARPRSLKMNLDGPKMPVPELAAMLPAMGVVLPNGSSLEGGTASIKLAMQGALERLVTTGTLSLDNTRLAHFDIGKKMAAIEKFAGMKGGPDTEIQTLGARVRVAPEGVTADDLQLIVPPSAPWKAAARPAPPMSSISKCAPPSIPPDCWPPSAVHPFRSPSKVPQPIPCSAPT